MEYCDQPTPFSSLPHRRAPWIKFVFSLCGQAACVAFLVWLRLMHPGIVSRHEPLFRSVQVISTPISVDYQSQNPVRHPVLIAKLDSLDTLRPSALRPTGIKSAVKFEASPAPFVKIPTRSVPTLSVQSAPVLPRVVNLFPNGTAVRPAISHRDRSLQMGGFGDPNGIVASANPSKAVNIAAVGKFDIPAASQSAQGSRSGTGGEGMVASTGFGASGAAVYLQGATDTTGKIQSSGFDETDVAIPPASGSHHPATEVLPAEILSKPTPVYTQEARKLHIEGEVLLEVILSASGTLRVVRVVRGLGHGLDDTAAQAAEQIRFKPATRNGRPADSTVVLHIVFQLA
jgi:TonB family protein